MGDLVTLLRALVPHQQGMLLEISESPKSPPNTQSSSQAIPPRAQGAHLSGKDSTSIDKMLAKCCPKGATSRER